MLTLIWGGIWFIVGGVLVGWLFLKQPAWAATITAWIKGKLGMG